MAKRKVRDWILTHKDLSFECRHCGARDARWDRRYPVSVNVWLAAAKAFQRTHGRCTPDTKRAVHPVKIEIGE